MKLDEEPMRSGAVARRSTVERDVIRRAFFSSEGRYPSIRASQLSGIPRRTINDWAVNGYFVPDFHRFQPKEWSYRDLVLLRLFAWLRNKGMPRTAVAKEVASVKATLAGGNGEFRFVRSQGKEVLLEDEAIDRVTGEQVFKEVLTFLSAFDLVAHVQELGSGHLWGPDLIRPRPQLSITPWVLAGEPVVRGTRVSTATIFALSVDRGLDGPQIERLYPGVPASGISQAINFEEQLRANAA